MDETRWSILRGSMDALIEIREALRLLEESEGDVPRQVRHHLTLAEESLGQAYQEFLASDFGR